MFFIKKGDADIFLEQLQQFNELIKQEWVSKGNRWEDFTLHGPRIILILDNASFHKRQDILIRLSEALPNFRLNFLPVYSPDYNIIELVWHSCKEYIAHRLFQSVDELKLLLDKLLNLRTARAKAGAASFAASFVGNFVDLKSKHYSSNPLCSSSPPSIIIIGFPANSGKASERVMRGKIVQIT